jgi:hypothetical protein
VLAVVAGLEIEWDGIPPEVCDEDGFVCPAPAGTTLKKTIELEILDIFPTVSYIPIPHKGLASISLKLRKKSQISCILMLLSIYAYAV